MVGGAYVADGGEIARIGDDAVQGRECQVTVLKLAYGLVDVDAIKNVSNHRGPVRNERGDTQRIIVSAYWAGWEAAALRRAEGNISIMAWMAADRISSSW